MSEKKKLNPYELKILASAYNLKNYCEKFQHCDDCIFNRQEYRCALFDCGTPYTWELEEGEAECI